MPVQRIQDARKQRDLTLQALASQAQVSVSMLSSVERGHKAPTIVVTLPPHCDAGEYPAWAPGSHEFIAVETGLLGFGLGGRSWDLAAGDSVYFAPDSPHTYRNPAATPCTYYVAALIMRPRTPRRQRQAAPSGR